MNDAQLEKEGWSEVPIMETVERMSEIILSDGTRLEYRAPAIKVWCNKNKFDENGNPLYHIRSGQLIAQAIEVKNHLKKK